MREQGEEGIVLRGLLYTPQPSCCLCQAKATATGKCQGANPRREKGGPASHGSGAHRASIKETRAQGDVFASSLVSQQD